MTEPVPASDALVFKSVDVLQIAGRGTIYVIELDRSCSNFRWIVDHDVMIDGKPFRVMAVEFQGHAPPYGPPARKNELIGLLVRSLA